MARNPLAGDVVKLSGAHAAYRRRVGSWRILFELYPGLRLAEVRYIKRRTTTTYRKR